VSQQKGATFIFAITLANVKCISTTTESIQSKTSISETIRKPPLVKAQTALKNQKNMAKNDFQYGGWNSYTLQCGTIMTLISPGDCTLQCGMWLWEHDSEFTKLQHPAT